MFWLDHDKPEQAKLAEQIDLLKSQRRFVTVLRDAMRLYLELEQGNIETLLEMYPWLPDRLQPDHQRDRVGDNSAEVEKKLDMVLNAVMGQHNQTALAHHIAQQQKAKPALKVEKDKAGDAKSISQNLLSLF
jgi:hypothetical protein